jgi:hypothetical protein
VERTGRTRRAFIEHRVGPPFTKTLPLFNSPKMAVDNSRFQTSAQVVKNIRRKSFRLQCASYSHSASSNNRGAIPSGLKQWACGYSCMHKVGACGIHRGELLISNY